MALDSTNAYKRRQQIHACSLLSSYKIYFFYSRLSCRPTASATLRRSRPLVFIENVLHTRGKKSLKKEKFKSSENRMEIVYNAKSFSRSSDGGWNNKNHFERLLQITSTIKSGFCIIKTWVGVEIPKSANVALPFWPILWALYDRNLQLQTCTGLPRQISSDYYSCGQSYKASTIVIYDKIGPWM